MTSWTLPSFEGPKASPILPSNDSSAPGGMLQSGIPPGTARQTIGELRQGRKAATVSRLAGRRDLPGAGVFTFGLRLSLSQIS